MKYWYLFIAVFFFAKALFSQSDQTRLVINPRGHTSIISGVALTADEKLLISVSHDKSIKIWSTEFGNVVHEIFGERGNGDVGQLYCVALSPDEKYLVVGGFLIEQHDDKVNGLIRVYDFAKRKLIKVIKGHQNVVHSLAFSPNGKYLASAGADGHVLVWNTQDFSLYNDFASHTKTARTVCFMNNDQLVSGGWDGKLIRYNLPSKKTDKFFAKDNYPVNEICYNADLKKLMVAFNEYTKLMVLNSDFELAQEVDVFMPIGAVATKGNKLIVGQERYPYITSIYQWVDNKFTVSNGFNGMNNTVTCAGLLKRGLAFSCGGRDNEIVFWNYSEASKDGMVNFGTEGVHLAGYGMSICATGFADNMVAFTQGNCDKMYGDGTLKNIFDLQSGGLYKLPAANEAAFRGIQKTKGEFVIKHEKGGILNYPDGMLSLNKKGEKIWNVTFDEQSGYGVDAYTFAGPNWIVAATKPDIYLFNMDGLQTAVLRGHESEVRALWTDVNGNYIISGGLDQTIRIWDISKVKNEKTIMKYDQLYPSSITFFKSKYPNLDFSTESGMKKLYEKVQTDFGDDTARFLITPAVIEPDANIFIGWNNEWIIWSNDGYFKSSKEGAKYIGYHINMGQDKDAKYYPFDQFDLKYNRPDIINSRLGIGDSTYNESLKKAHERRLKKMGLNEEDLTGDKNLPTVEILSTVANTNEKTYKLEIKALAETNELYKINIYNNDVPVFGTKGFLVEDKDKKSLKKVFDVPLVPGQNKIQVSAVNKNGVESLRETITILSTNLNEKGNLYIVTIGVSDYANNDFNLKYAAKDAGDVLNMFNKSGLYNKVFTKSFTNDKVNKDMLPLVKEFLAKAEANDQVIIFIAGHGVLSSSFDYYFAAHNMDFEHPEKYGISYTEIEGLLDDIRSLKKILFMDTCHSGEVDKDDVEQDTKAVELAGNVQFRNVGTNVKHKSLGMQQTTELMKEVFNDMRKGTGSNVISSASGYELAQESKDWHNGLFTYVLVNGIQSTEADLNKDGKIMLSELKVYTGYKVSEMSNGVQTPASRNENISFDYRIW